MKKIMLRWISEGYSFWDLACYACGCCEGWHTSFCSWRSNSCIAVATCRQCGAKQFLKKYHKAGDAVKSVAQSQWEYEVLGHLDGGNRSGLLFRVPRAYNFAAKTSALSMEYVQGESMDERMRHARDRQRLDDCLRISAAWLRGLHAASPIYDKTGNGHASMLRRLESDCRSLAARNRMVAQALTCMRCSSDKVNSLPAERVPLHGDFKPSNLMWTSGGVYGIDIGLRFKNPGVMDAAQFVANVLLNRGGIPAIAGEHDVALILDVFLEAYGDNSQPTRNLTAWWLLYFLLSRWEEDLDGWKPSMFVDLNYAAAVADAMSFCESIGLLASPVNQ